MVKERLSKALVSGNMFIINFDDTDEATVVDESRDPDLREFYSATHFPSQIWEPELIKRPEVYEKLFAGTTSKGKHKISSRFQMILWSKFKIDQELDNKNIIEKFERRFSTVLPVNKIDLVMISEEAEKI